MGEIVDSLKRCFDVLEVYHTGRGSMRALLHQKPDSRVNVRKIKSNGAIKNRLEELGIREGQDLCVLGHTPWYELNPAILVMVDKREVMLDYSIARKVLVS